MFWNITGGLLKWKFIFREESYRKSSLEWQLWKHGNSYRERPSDCHYQALLWNGLKFELLVGTWLCGHQHVTYVWLSETFWAAAVITLHCMKVGFLWQLCLMSIFGFPSKNRWLGVRTSSYDCCCKLWKQHMVANTEITNLELLSSSFSSSCTKFMLLPPIYFILSQNIKEIGTSFCL